MLAAFGGLRTGSAQFPLLAILSGWSLSTSVTPFSVVTMTASRYSGEGLRAISLRRNWAFALVSGMLACAVLTGYALWLG